MRRNKKGLQTQSQVQKNLLLKWYTYDILYNATKINNNNKIQL